MRTRLYFLTLERPSYALGAVSFTPVFPILSTLLLDFCCLLLLEVWGCVSPGSLLTQAFGVMRRRTISLGPLLVFLSPFALRSRFGTCCCICGATFWHGAVFAGPTTGLALPAVHTLLGWTLRTLVLGFAATGRPGDTLTWSIASERDIFALWNILGAWVGTWRLAVAVAQI